MEGLTIGAGMSDNEEATGVTIDETTMYATYATGGFTIGVQASDRDHETAGSDAESNTHIYI
jgi:hypothetical protein